MRTSLRFAIQSQMGMRSNNEDAAYASPRFLALADGMGGHAAGEVAATLAIRELLTLEKDSPSDLIGNLRKAFDRANGAIAERVTRDPQTSGMGTTLTALLFDGRHVALGHVGDSRAYLLRNGSLRQLTTDDTFVQSLVEDGRMSPDEAAVHPRRNMLLKVLSGQTIQPHFEVREVDIGDRYLICSDGLSDYVSAAEIAGTLQMPDPQQRPQQLIRLALRRGSQDNITCVVGDVVKDSSGYNIALLSGAPGEEACVIPA